MKEKKPFLQKKKKTFLRKKNNERQSWKIAYDINLECYKFWKSKKCITTIFLSIPAKVVTFTVLGSVFYIFAI